MALGSTDTMAGQRTLTAFFDSNADAQSAVQRLAAAGIPRSAIDIRSGTSASAGATTSTGRESDQGFWETLKDIFMSEDDRATYAEGLRRGGHIVVVRTDAQHYEQALDILDDEGTIDLDQRAESWRKEGWQGSQHTSSLGGAGATTSALGATSLGQINLGGARTGTTPGTTGTGSNLTAGREEVIPISEEQLRVGKREVSHGRVRVRSYVVETPVNEQVGLREEHVSVQRRPVDRAATGTENLFKERVIETEERAEEAVVAKEARVKEELVIRKDADQRTQTVSDTVRRTEVEVEDDRTGATRTGTTGTAGSKDRKIS
jgi:uncharacterized protein (TIGR02271 family)